MPDQKRNEAVAELMGMAGVLAFTLDDNATDLLADALGLLAGANGEPLDGLTERSARAHALLGQVGDAWGVA